MCSYLVNYSEVKIDDKKVTPPSFSVYSVCAFYVAATSDMVKKFPFGEEHMILKCYMFVNFYNKLQSTI